MILNDPISKKFGALFMVWLLLILPFASAVSITDITSTPSQNGALISFKTNESAQALVNVQGKGNFPPDGTPLSAASQTHSIQISGLAPSTTYTYTVKATGTKDLNPTSSAIKSFTTPASNGEIFLTPDLPTIVNSGKLTYTGKTLPDAIVTALVDGVIATNGIVVASATGDFSLTLNLNPALPQNTVVIQVNDAASGKKKEISQVITIDTIFPEFTNITIPSVSSSTSVSIKGTVNKPMSITAYATYPDGKEKTFGPEEVSAASNFNFNVELDDGVNQILVRGTDATGMQIEKEGTVTVDSVQLSPPEIEWTKYSPVSTSSFTIDGYVNKPGISVRIYADPREARSLPGSCKTTSSKTLTTSGEVLTNTDCYGFGQFSQVEVNGSYYDGVSDTKPNSEGLYPFSIDVMLEPRLTIFVQDKLQIKTYNSPTTGNALDANNQEDRFNAGINAGSTEDYNLFAVAVDKIGTVAATGTYRISKEQCGNTGDYMVRIGQMYPDLIQPDHIFQGIAQISFKAELQYTGAYDSNSVYITGADIVPRPVSDADLERYGTDPREILDTNRCKISPSSGITDYVYMVCDLNRFPSSAVRTNITKAYKILENISAVKFPIIFNVEYDYMDSYNHTYQKKASQCMDIAIRFDKRLSPDKYPKGLLKSTVNVMNTTVVAIDKVLKPLNTIKLVTLGACVGSKVFTLFSYAKEEYGCINEGFAPASQAKIEQALRGCKDFSSCSDKFKTADGPIIGKFAGTETKAEDSMCALKIWNRLKTEEKVNYLCDRIFCPAVPSASEYIKQVNQKPTKKLTSACATDNSNYNYAPNAAGPVDGLTTESGCGLEYQTTWKSACPWVNPLEKSKAQARQANDRDKPKTFLDVVSNMNICTAAERSSQSKQDYVTLGGNTYFNNNPDQDTSCFRLGKVATSGKFDKTTDELIVNKQTEVNKYSDAAVNIDISKPENFAAKTAITDNNCVVTTNDNNVIFQFKDEKTGQPLQFLEKDAVPAQVSLSTNGQTQAYSTSVVQFKAADGNVGGLDQQGNYYKLTKGTAGQADAEWQAIRPSDTGSDKFFARACSNAVVQGTTATQYSIYNPANPECKPITDGPDQLKQNQGPAYIVNPTDGFINSLTCGCIPALEGYLIVWRNVFNAVKNCFQATLVNGEFKSGACRSLLTTYICDWIYRALKCITSLASGLEKVGQAQGGGTDTGIGAIQSLQRGADKMSKSMQDRYGNTATYNSLISSRKIINSVCLAAFGYDWLPELDQAVSIKGGGAAVNSTAFIVAASRRWLSSDPTSGKATFVYEAGYFISAGSPITYQVYLVCSNDNSCRNTDGYENSGQCDCAYPGTPGEVKHRIDGGTVSGGETVGDAGNNQGQRIVKLDADFRYDKVRLIFKDTVTPEAKEQVIEQRITRLGGQEPPTCSFSILTFKFQCDYASTNKYGDIFFYGEKIKPDQDPYGINNPLNMAVFAKVDYTKKVGIEKQTLPPSDQLYKYAKLQVWNEAHNQLLYEEVTPKGTINANTDLLIMGSNYRIGDGQSPRGVAGTIRASGVPIAITESGSSVLPYNLNSMTASRASSKVIYYIFYNTYKPESDSSTGKLKEISKSVTDKKWYILRQYVGSSTSTQPFPTLSSINNQIAQQNTAGNSALVSSGTLGIIQSANNYNDATKVLQIDADNGVQIKLDNFDATKAYTGVINYDTQSTSTLMCGANQKTINFYVTVSLHDSIADNRKLTVSNSNSKISPEVFTYQGLRQNVSKIITVNCDGTSTAKTGLRQCPTNVVTWRTQWPAITTSNFVEGCYCGDTAKNAFESTSDSSLICMYGNNVVSPLNTNLKYCDTTITSDCYCGDKSKVTSSVATQDNLGMYCTSKDRCSTSNGVYACVTKTTTATQTAPISVLYPQVCKDKCSSSPASSTCSVCKTNFCATSCPDIANVDCTGFCAS